MCNLRLAVHFIEFHIILVYTLLQVVTQGGIYSSDQQSGKRKFRPLVY